MSNGKPKRNRPVPLVAPTPFEPAAPTVPESGGDAGPAIGPGPFALQGRQLRDAQTSCKPAGRVLMAHNKLTQLLGVPAGVPDTKTGKLFYEANLPGARYVSVEQAWLRLSAYTLQLESRLLAMGDLLQMVVHGASVGGLHIHSTSGSRKLGVSATRLILFHEAASAGSDWDIRIHEIAASPNVPLYLVAGDSLVDEQPSLGVPEVCASGPGSVVAQPSKEYRVDLLAVAPLADAEGETGRAEWYLFLGASTKALTLQDVVTVRTPDVPAPYRRHVLPVARVVTRQGVKGITELELLAMRTAGQ